MVGRAPRCLGVAVKKYASWTFCRAIAGSLSPIPITFEEAALESFALIRRRFSNFFSSFFFFVLIRRHIYSGLLGLMPLLLLRATIAFLMNTVIYITQRLLLSVYWARKPGTSKAFPYHLCFTLFGYRRVIDRRGIL